MVNATVHVLRQYSPENFIRLPISLKGKSELVADGGNDDDVAIAVASLALADAGVCAEGAVAAAAAAVADVVVDESARSFQLFELAGAAPAAAVAAVSSPSVGVVA